MQKTKLIMIDDDPFFLRAYKAQLSDEYIVLTATSSTEGFERILKEKPGVALLDISMKTEQEGLELLTRIKIISHNTICIMVTNLDSHTIYKSALKRGADDFFVKSDKIENLKKLLKNHIAFSEFIPGRDVNYIAESPLSKSMFSLAHTASRSMASVIVYGETGSGKEVVARFIHGQSARANKPFIAVNCAAVQDTLFESTFFGHEKGSFTGAYQKQIGKFEAANGGTIFLDELEDLSPKGQAALLRVLQDSSFERIGGTTMLSVDVRIIVALKSDLAQLVMEQKFREDLYYRLAVFTIYVPPLRERCEDIIPLTQLFLKQSSENEKRLDDNCNRLLKAYNWPGNIRELQNVIERAAALTPSDTIRPVHLGLEKKTPKELADYQSAREQVLTEFQKKFYNEALLRNQGNISKTAKEIGVSRQTLQTFLAGKKKVIN